MSDTVKTWFLNLNKTDDGPDNLNSKSFPNGNKPEMQSAGGIPREINIAVFHQDRELRYLWALDPYFGFSSEKIRSKKDEDIFRPEDAGLLRDIKEKVIENGRGIRQTISLNVKGKKQNMDLMIEPVKSVDGSITGLIGIAMKIPRETDLYNNERYFRAMIQAANEGIWILNSDDEIILANDKISEMLGYKEKELIGRPAISFCDIEDIEKGKKQLEERHYGRPARFEIRFRRKDGSLLWTLISSTPLIDTQGRYAGTVTMLLDISELKKAEEKLIESEAKFRGLFETMKDGAVRVDVNDRFIETNPAFREMLGYTEEEIKRMTVWDITPPQWHFQHKKLRRELLTRSYSDIYDKEYIRKDGTVFPVSSRAWAIKDANGFPIGAWAIVRDITELRKAEEEARKLNARYMEIFESVTEGIVFVDENEVIRICNPGLAQIYDADKPEDIISRSVFDLLPKNQRPIISEQTAMRKQGLSSKYELEIITLKGNIKTIFVSASPRFDEENRFLGTFATAIDITERKKVERALHRSEEMYRTIVETANEGIWMLDNQDRITFTNKNMAKMLGYDPEELIGRPVYDFMDTEDRRIMHRHLMKRRRGKRGQYVVGLRRKDGSNIWVAVSSGPLRNSGDRYAGTVKMMMNITQLWKNNVRERARYDLLNRLRSQRQVHECLELGCRAIIDSQVFDDTVFGLHSNESEICYIGEIFQEGHRIIGIEAPDDKNGDLMKFAVQEKFRLHNSYLIPKEKILSIVRAIGPVAPELGGHFDINDAFGALFIPVEHDEEPEGWLVIAIPRQAGKPSSDIVHYLEGITGIVMQRIKQLRYRENLESDKKILNEKNIALREVLATIKDGKSEIRREIAETISNLIMPAFEKLLRADGTVNKAHYRVLRENLGRLAESTSAALPFSEKLSLREAEICTMLKSGATSKEIADSLGIALVTVQKHRELIRKKLGLTNKNVNLTVYLRAMESKLTTA